MDTLLKSLWRAAAVPGRHEALRQILAKGVPVDAESPQGRTALQLAVEHGDLATVKQLIAAGADMHRGSSCCHASSFHIAAAAGHIPVLKLFLNAGGDVDTSNDNNHIPLMFAAMWGSAAAAKLLIEAGAAVDRANSYGLTALHWAALHDESEVVKVVLAVGADPYLETNGFLRTPLAVAAEQGSIAAVDTLLQHAAMPLGTIISATNALEWERLSDEKLDALKLLVEHIAT